MRAVGVAAGVVIGACFAQPPAPAQKDGGSGSDAQNGSDGGGVPGVKCSPQLYMSFEGAGDASSCSGTFGSAQPTASGLLFTVNSTSTASATCHWSLPADTQVAITAWKSFAPGAGAQTTVEMQDLSTGNQNELRYSGAAAAIELTNDLSTVVGSAAWSAANQAWFAFAGYSGDVVAGYYSGDFTNWNLLGSTSWLNRRSAAGAELYISLTYGGTGTGSALLSAIYVCP